MGHFSRIWQALGAKSGLAGMPHSVGSPGLVGVIAVCFAGTYFSLLLWLAAPHEEPILSAVPAQDR